MGETATSLTKYFPYGLAQGEANRKHGHKRCNEQDKQKNLIPRELVWIEEGQVKQSGFKASGTEYKCVKKLGQLESKKECQQKPKHTIGQITKSEVSPMQPETLEQGGGKNVLPIFENCDRTKDQDNEQSYEASSEGLSF